MWAARHADIRRAAGHFTRLEYNAALGLFIFLTVDGRAYAVKDLSGSRRVRLVFSIAVVTRLELMRRLRQGSRHRQLSEDSRFYSLPTPNWDGQCFYGASRSPDLAGSEDLDSAPQPLHQKAICVAVNERFSLVALGLERWVEIWPDARPAMWTDLENCIQRTMCTVFCHHAFAGVHALASFLPAQHAQVDCASS